MMEGSYDVMNSMMNTMMMNMQGMLGQYTQTMLGMQNQMNQSLLDDTPEVYKSPDIDWQATQDELNARATLSEDLDAAKRYNFGTSVHTSPLLDDEEATTTLQSLIAS